MSRIIAWRRRRVALVAGLVLATGLVGATAISHASPGEPCTVDGPRVSQTPAGNPLVLPGTRIAWSVDCRGGHSINPVVELIAQDGSKLFLAQGQSIGQGSMYSAQEVVVPVQGYRVCIGLNGPDGPKTCVPPSS